MRRQLQMREQARQAAVMRVRALHAWRARTASRCSLPV
jgi:hypothetical protein